MSFKLAVVFGTLVISGAMLLTSVGIFKELQIKELVFLGFSLIVFGAVCMIITAIKQDDIDNRKGSHSFSNVERR